MMEPDINRNSYNPVHEILKGRFCGLNELSGKEWKNAMELDNLRQKVAEVATNYSGLQILYTRNGKGIVITTAPANTETEFIEDRSYIGIRRIPGDSYSLLVRGDLPRLMEFGDIGPILNTEIAKLNSDIVFSNGRVF